MKQTKNIIITGASGLVATQLAFDLLERGEETRLFLLSMNPAKLIERYQDYVGRVYCFSLDEFRHSSFCKDTRFDVCVHAAFARTSNGKDLADALEYAYRLLETIRNIQVKRFVNISSQSVYGKIYKPLWKESLPLAPDYMYALGKYQTELMTRMALQRSRVAWTNVRLSSVCENARFVNIFVKNALAGIPIHLTAGNQICSFIDVRDVSSGLLSIIDSPLTTLDEAYNMGTGEQLSIRQIAEKVKKTGDERYGTSVVITEEPNESKIAIGMDNSLFRSTFSWMPTFSMDDMIVSLFEMHTNIDGGGYPLSFKIVYDL